jgi:predicted secreted Zn-dependent protease
VTGASRVETSYRKGVKYYEVSGKTSAEIRSSIRKHGPKGNDGSYWGLFTSVITVGDVQKQNCIPLKLHVAALMTLPRHATIAQHGAPLAAWWDRSINGLTLHELGHEKVLLKEVARLEGALSTVPYSSCQDLRQTAQDLIRVAYKRMRISQDSFDLVTQHGRRPAPPSP